MTEIVYPQGCKPLREDLGQDELIRRLKVSEFYLNNFFLIFFIEFIKKKSSNEFYCF